MKKRIILPAILLTGALTMGSLGISTANAQQNNFSPLARRVASRFNLDPKTVQEVFEEVHLERQAEMEANMIQRLEDMVVDGKITESQKQLILDKYEEMQAKMDEWKDLDPNDRRQKMQAYHKEIKAWAAVNGLDFPFPMMMKHGSNMSEELGPGFEYKFDH